MMLDQDAVERAASEVATRVGWHVVLVRPGGRLKWIVNYSGSGRFRSVTVPVDADTTEADIQRLIEKKLNA